jgi:hypothetical protein
MLWYGSKNKNTKSILSKNKKLVNLKTKKCNWNIASSTQLNKQTFFLHTPFQWNVIISENTKTKKKSIFLYNQIYFFSLALPNNYVECLYDKNTRTLSLHTLYINNFYKIFWWKLRECITIFYQPKFLKLKFKGKGYYVYKNKRNTITPQFGYAHRLYLYSYFVSVKFLSKTSIFIFGFLQTDLLKIGYGLKKMRPINIFTGRGVRFSKQVIYKKVGKVSSYR